LETEHRTQNTQAASATHAVINLYRKKECHLNQMRLCYK